MILKKYIFRLSIICILFSMIFLSCNITKPLSGDNNVLDEELNPVYVTNRKKIDLLPPTALSHPLQTYQLIEGQFGKDSFTMMAYTEIVDEGIFISLFNDFGTDMGTVSYDGQKVFFESPYFPKNLKGEYVISDIQNAFYNEELLEENYRKAGLTFKVIKNLEKGQSQENYLEVRQILDGEKVLEEIKIGDTKIIIKNYLRNYEYILTDGGLLNN